MSTICVGGVCVPYSAVIPLLLLGLKYALAKLYAWGLLPSFLADLLNLDKINTKEGVTCCAADQKNEEGGDGAGTGTTKRGKRGKQARSVPAAAASSSSSREPSIGVKEIASKKQFDELFSGNTDVVVVMKFTASWCKPCHSIQPFYEEQSKLYPHIDFLLLDVDDLDDFATAYDVKIMPTFVIVKGSHYGSGVIATKATYSGSKPEDLEKFLKTNLPAAPPAAEEDNSDDDKKNK